VRYYKIAIVKKGQTSVWQSSSLPASVKDASYTSVVNGSSNSSALDIELNLPVFTLATPRGPCRVRIWGIDIKEASQITDLQGATISIWGGMTTGDFPLSIQHTPDLLVRGTVWQSSGNWVGNQTFIDFVIVPLIADNIDPKSFVGQPLHFSWAPSQDFIDAVKQMVNATYGQGSYTVKGQVSPDLQTPGVVDGQFHNLTEFGSFIRQHTNGTLPGSAFASLKGVNGSPYTGVEFFVFDKTIFVSDPAQTSSPTGGSSVDKPKQIVFNDLIGQPSWKNAYTINFITMLRGDLQPLDFIKLPDVLAAPFVGSFVPPGGGIGPGAVQFPSRNASVFQGKFQITEMHHFAHFRQATGEAWVTSIDALTLNTQSPPPVQQGVLAPAPVLPTLGGP
jgi:hypothetical protein